LPHYGHARVGVSPPLRLSNLGPLIAHREVQDLCQAANEKRLRQQGARCRSTHTAAPRRSLAICSLAPLRRSTRPTPRASPTGTCAPSWLRTPLTAASRRLRGRSRREGRRLSRPPVTHGSEGAR